MSMQGGNDPLSAATTVIPDELKAAFRKFKLGGKKQENCVFVMKISVKKLEVMLDYEESGVSIEDIAMNLPDSIPRFIVYSYKHTHKDGRVSYPLIFIYYCPTGGPTNTNILYSSTKPLIADALQIKKIFDCKDSEEMTEEWLLSKLAFFGA